MKKKVQISTDEKHRNELSGKAVLLSLICVSSFHVDRDHLHSILSNPKDLSVLIQNSIVIEEGRNCITSALDTLAPILHLNWKQLMLRASSIIVQNINNVTPSALDDAIRQSWSAYNPGTKWKKASEKNNDWLFAMTASQSGVNALPVHYNILTGELLVDGDRLSSLPPKYEQHSTYRLLFGRSSLEIMPSGLAGMRYSTKTAYAGHTVHFGLSDEKTVEGDLRIRAVHPDQTMELIPPRLFRDKFPSAFVENFVHWYDISKQQIEFRPLGSVWRSSSEDWTLTRTIDGRGWQLLWPESCQRLPNFSFAEPNLLTRDLIRSSSFRVSSFGAEEHKPSHDRDYHGRDRGQASEAGMRVFMAADLIYHERQGVYPEGLHDSAASSM